METNLLKHDPDLKHYLDELVSQYRAGARRMLLARITCFQLPVDCCSTGPARVSRGPCIGVQISPYHVLR